MEGEGGWEACRSDVVFAEHLKICLNIILKLLPNLCASAFSTI